jgi:hypothetical protein
MNPTSTQTFWRARYPADIIRRDEGDASLAEARGQGRDLAVELLQRRLVGIYEFRAGAEELLLVALDELQRFRIEVEVRALPVHRVDASEEGRVEQDGIVVRVNFGAISVSTFSIGSSLFDWVRLKTPAARG